LCDKVKDTSEETLGHEVLSVVAYCRQLRPVTQYELVVSTTKCIEWRCKQRHKME